MNFKEYVLKHVDGRRFAITKEMTEGRLFDIRDCTGARLLKSITPEKYHKYIKWGSYTGLYNYYGKDKVKITSNTSLMEAKQGDIIRLRVEQNT